jgi:two-component system, LytTR family, sensor kinase
VNAKPQRSTLLRLSLVFGGWTALGLLLAAQAWLSFAMRGEPIAWVRSLAIWLCWAWVWAALTPVALWLLERFPLERPQLVAHSSLHAWASVVFACTNLAAFALFAPWVGAVSEAPTWWATFTRLLGAVFLLDLPVYWLLVGVGQGFRLASTAQRRERRTMQLEAQLSEARLEALRTQLRPHFMFNALNTVSALMHEDVAVADRVLLRLSALLRASLEGGDTAEVSLREELSLVEAHLAIEQARYEDRLSFRLSVGPELLDARVPRLLLQPLVENAVEHGVAPRRGPGTIEIAASRQGEFLCLSVIDDGPGLAENATDGIGLSNTRGRLALLYAGRHRFELLRSEAGGLHVKLTLPLRMEADT